MYLTKEAILASKGLRTIDVECPDLGGKVRLRSMTAAQASQFYKDTKDDDAVTQSAKSIAVCLVDAEGKPVFTVEEVLSFGMSCVDFLARETLKLNSGRPLEEIKKNSETTDGGESSSASVEQSA